MLLCFDSNWICFLMHFYNQCAYTEVIVPTEDRLLYKRFLRGLWCVSDVIG